jgi:hypothetical protein
MTMLQGHDRLPEYSVITRYFFHCRSLAFSAFSPLVLPIIVND